MQGYGSECNALCAANRTHVVKKHVLSETLHRCCKSKKALFTVPIAALAATDNGSSDAANGKE